MVFVAPVRALEQSAICDLRLEFDLIAEVLPVALREARRDRSHEHGGRAAAVPPVQGTEC